MRRLGSVALLLGCSAARAQVGPQVVSPEAGAVKPREVRLLAGVQGFSSGLSEGTNPGPFVGLVAELRPWVLAGVELAYEVARLPVEAGRAPGRAALWSHTVLGLVKLGAPVTERLRPFFATGLGLATLHPTEAASGLFRSDVLVELPLVLGVDTRLGPLSAGLRLSYRSVLDDAFHRAEPRPADGGLLSASLEVGGRF